MVKLTSGNKPLPGCICFIPVPSTMDIVGVIPRSSLEKRYILVICDYATRYPEALALRIFDTVTVSQEWIGFFSRVGSHIS